MEETLERSSGDRVAAASVQPLLEAKGDAKCPRKETPVHAKSLAVAALAIGGSVPLAQMRPPGKKRRRDGKRELAPSEPSRPERKGRLSSPENVEDLPGLAKLDAIVAMREELRAPGIDGLWKVDEGQFDVLVDADMDGEPQIRKVADGKQAVITTGVATCYALCARGKDSAGKTLLGISHVSAGPNNEDARAMAEYDIGRLVDAMKEEGAGDDLQLFVVGGQVSLYIPEDVRKRDDDPTAGTLHYGVRLMNAARQWLVAARIGLSETEKHPGEYEPGFRKGPTSHRPEAVAVYLTKCNVFYVPQG
jgi:hypothetical protein